MAGASSIDPEAHRLMRSGRFAEALPLAERAVAGARLCLPGHALLASILLKLGRAADAADVVACAAALATGAADAYDGLAYVSTELGQHEQGNLLYRRAVELEPATPRFWYNLASSERSFGRLAEAEEACNRSIALDAAQYRSYLLRSELRVQSPASNHVGELEARLADPHLGLDGRIYLGYALAKELDDVERFDEAFRWFTAAATARRSQLRYDVATDERTLRRIAQVFRRDLQPGADAERGGADIFIVGLPRSGTTLVERILTGLAGVRSNGETDNFSRALMGSVRMQRGDLIERAAAADPLVVAARYERLARATGSDRKIIEKLPTNFLYLGAICRALPSATVVRVTRSPLDSCFAMYRSLFGEAYPFSYDFDELARYYAAYETLMRHWRSVHGEAIHEVAYEDLVRTPHAVGAVLAERCGLTWMRGAIDIERNTSVSLTASAAQVRRPIYGSSSGRWRHYHRQLMPLIGALRRRGIPLPEDA